MSINYEFGFGLLTVHEEYVVAKMNYGMTIDDRMLEDYDMIINRHYSQKNFGYITIREHSYAVNPSVYKAVSRYPNLKGIAVVDPYLRSKLTFPVEKMFFEGPMHRFSTEHKAVSWIRSLLKPQESTIVKGKASLPAPWQPQK